MRYCLSCRKMTSGDASYCNYCGRTFDVKLCPRGHPNVRGSDVCATCGSRDLSIPQRRSPVVTWVFRIFALVLPFLVLVVVTLGYIGIFLRTLLTNSSDLLPLMLLGLALGLLWLVWMHLSSALRELLFGRNKTGIRK